MRAFALTVLIVAGAAAAQDAEKGDAGAEKPGLDISKMIFSKESIRTVVDHHTEKIQGCYNEMLAGRQKVVEGKIQTSFTITPEGLVKSARVLKKGSTLFDKRFNECVVSVLSTMEFPKPEKNRDYPIEYPFNLTAEK